jgi:hypothetical protein
MLLQQMEAQCSEINSLNQRGGRMLSIIDLISRQTISLDLASYLAVAIQQGISFLIGAESGGAGKTTIMGALLGLIPNNCELKTIPNEKMISTRLKGSSIHPCMLLVHEIGKGNWFGYLWGNAIKDVLSILDQHTFLASNLHQDTFEAVTQTFSKFGISFELFNKISFLIFLHYEASTQKREIREIWEQNNNNFHLIYEINRLPFQFSNKLHYYNPELIISWKDKLKSCLDQQIFTIKDVKKYLAQN